MVFISHHQTYLDNDNCYFFNTNFKFDQNLVLKVHTGQINKFLIYPPPYMG
jgi:hypothetical protein